MTDLARLAEITDEAARSASAIAQLSETGYAITLDQAYDVQRMSIDRRKARGESMVGVKMGFTSRAKQIQMGLSGMVWGRLTDGMRVEDGGEIKLSNYVHPRVEPEVAFILKRPLSGKVTPLEALSAVEAVAGAVEIIDSRYDNFKFNLPDVVADNASSSSFVLGPWCKPDLDVSNLGILLEFNGQPVQIGSSAAILGHPARALAGASRLVAKAGIRLEEGWIVLAGGATGAHKLEPDISVRADIETLGCPTFSVVA